MILERTDTISPSVAQLRSYHTIVLWFSFSVYSNHRNITLIQSCLAWVVDTSNCSSICIPSLSSNWSFASRIALAVASLFREIYDLTIRATKFHLHPGRRVLGRLAQNASTLFYHRGFLYYMHLLITVPNLGCVVVPYGYFLIYNYHCTFPRFPLGTERRSCTLHTNNSSFALEILTMKYSKIDYKNSETCAHMRVLTPCLLLFGSTEWPCFCWSQSAARRNQFTEYCYD